MRHYVLPGITFPKKDADNLRHLWEKCNQIKSNIIDCEKTADIAERKPSQFRRSHHILFKNMTLTIKNALMSCLAGDEIFRQDIIEFYRLYVLFLT